MNKFTELRRDSQQDAAVEYPDEIKEAIFNLTGGFAGLTRHIINDIYVFCKNRSVNGESVVDYLYSNGYHKGLAKAARCFVHLRNWVPDRPQSQLIRYLLRSK